MRRGAAVALAACLCATSGASFAQVADVVFAGGFEPGGERAITLTVTGTVNAQEQVNLGIPFAPGALLDAGRVRILDNAGNEVPAFVKPTLRWHATDGSIRAVKVQFFADPAGSYRFDTSSSRTRSIAELPYDNGTRPGKQDAPIPRVLATLPAAWLVASQIAGPQLAAAGSAYDQYVARQWQWARDTSYSGVHGFLFDRAAVIGMQYVRNGNPEYLREFYNSATFYLSKIKTSGSGGGWPDCTGGWQFDGVNACDAKYAYLHPQLLLVGLAGDDTRLATTTIRHMVDNQIRGGWNLPLQPYNGAGQAWTERGIGLALEHIVSGYEITGDPAMRQAVVDVVGYLHAHQQTPPAGDAYSGGWTHSWCAHEQGTGCSYNPSTDTRGSSPWQAANVVGGLWRAWLATRDPRIPTMLRGWGRYLEDYGWIGAAGFAAGGTTWRSSCNSNGAIAWYFSSPIDPLSEVVAIQHSDGWYSDSHNPELLMAVAVARYFETDSLQRAAYDQRAVSVQRYFNANCAAISGTVRAFNWQHRNPEALWLLAQ